MYDVGTMNGPELISKQRLRNDVRELSPLEIDDVSGGVVGPIVRALPFILPLVVPFLVGGSGGGGRGGSTFSLFNNTNSLKNVVIVETGEGGVTINF